MTLRPPCRAALFSVAVGVLLVVPVVPAAEPEAMDELRFRRVHVPRDALSDAPLGASRYVPMPRDEFEAAVARGMRAAGTESSPGIPPADAARYEARIDSAGRLEGSVAFDIGSAAAAVAELPLGGLVVSECTARTAAGIGAAAVTCRADGTLAILPVGAGAYSAAWSAAPPLKTDDGPLYALPLLPAVRASISLQVPPGRRPLFVGLDLPPVWDGKTWTVEAGNRRTVEFLLQMEMSPVPLFAWSTIEIAAREVAITTALEPAVGWTGAPVVIEKEPALNVTAVESVADGRHVVTWSEAADGRSITCFLPPVTFGRRDPLVVRAVGPLPETAVRPLPTLRAPAAVWAGGGSVVHVDPALALATIDCERSLMVTAEAAAAWPLPSPIHDSVAAGADLVVPARVFVEHQEPRGEIRVAVAPRTPRLDVARLTVVDFAPGVVVGVATCDVGVQRGEAFDLQGLVAPGWFIDAVDVVGWSQPLPWADAAAEPAAMAADPLEWKVVRDARGDLLRVGLATAVTPGRRLRLRITGHRAGAPAGTVYPALEIDMVQLAGETTGLAAVGFRTGPDQIAEIEGANAGPLDPRLMPLVTDPAVRAWVPAGGRSSAWQVRFERRRPPLDVQVQVRLTARDDRLSQSFTFECRPDASDLEAVVVRFSEPMDDQLEWSLLEPANGVLVARRLETVEESWQVELTPPGRGAVTIRAIRTVPLEGAVSMPLAWIEGAARQAGEVIVRDAGRQRPRIVNRRLQELPPEPGGTDQWPPVIGAFSFSADDAAATLPPAVELVAGSTADNAARAWAWRETTSCWCYASGRTEYETEFTIESHGRSSVVLGISAGRRLQGIEIDGVPVPLVGGENVASVPIDLPVGRPSFKLVVRSIRDTLAHSAWWGVEPAGVVVDLPVLERLCRVFVPPELEIAAVSGAWRSIGRSDRGVAGRLFGIDWPRPASSPPATHEPLPDTAFLQRDFVPVTGRSDSGSIVVVRTRWVAVATVVVGILVVGAAIALNRRHGWVAPVCCVLAGVAALWSPVPVDAIARAAWWGAVAAAILAGWRGMLRPTPIAVAILCTTITARGAEPARVFVTPSEDGEIALVPEPLFRILARTEPGDAATIRVTDCRVTVPLPRADGLSADRWRVTIDIDAAAAGVLWLGPQVDAASWVADSAQLDGRPVKLAGPPDRREVVVPTPGRHRLEVDAAPRVDRRGDVEVSTVAMPPAPVASIEFASEGGRTGDPASGLRCEASTLHGPFVEIPGAWSTERGRFIHDASRASRVRIVRSRADGVALAATRPVVESKNTVFWELDACRVLATFTVDSRHDIPGPCVVRADRGLKLVDPVDPALDVTELPGNRFLVGAAAPTAGRFRFELSFRMPLVDPVGRFTVPGVWIEDPAVEMRTTSVLPATDLAVQIETPAPLVSLPAEETGGDAVTAWRSEVRAHEVQSVQELQTQGVSGSATGDARARIVVERRRQEIRGTQDVRVRFAAERTLISLTARLDASSTPLAVVPLEMPEDCVIDSVSLLDDGLHAPEPLERGPIEAHWSSLAPGKGELTVQRPRAGRFRLEVAGHIARPPAPTGRVPVVRAALPGAPSVVSWNESPGGNGADRFWELRSDERPPLYAFRTIVLPETNVPASVEPQLSPEQAARVEPRVELAEVELTFENRARAWGRARFDVVTQDRLLRLALPLGMRLFEVCVDGRPITTATPSPAATAETTTVGERWDIRLHDAGWPRSIEVVYAGTVGGAADDDGPLALQAPTIVGLPCARCLWTLRAPPDAVVRVADHGRLAAPATFAEERAAALGGLRGDFDRAIALAGEPVRSRLREELAARERRLAEQHAGSDVMPEPPEATVNVVAAPADAALTVRIDRKRDATIFARAWATTAMLVFGGVAWVVARANQQR